LQSHRVLERSTASANYYAAVYTNLKVAQVIRLQVPPVIRIPQQREQRSGPV
jgi:hypothetical protein